jgi:ABC-type transport system involved in multi-copper enzyme maturation permease subunit
MQANPVIVKELRGRMRGWRAPAVLVAYLVVLSLVSWLVYAAAHALTGILSSSPESAQVGKILFGVLVVFQTIMVSLLTPAFTAGTITSEREQKTYDLLMTTLLRPRSVVLGKLGSALAYMVLLILAIAPIESLAFMFGGVSPEEIVLSQVTLMAAALLYASVGIFWSSLLRSSIASNVLTYGTIIFQLIFVPFLYYTITSIMGAYSYDPSGQSLGQQPWYWYMSNVVLSSNPLIAMIMSEAFYLNGDPLFIYTSSTMLNGHTVLVVSPWLLFCIEALLGSVLLVLLSIRFIQPVRHRRRARRTGATPQYTTN